MTTENNKLIAEFMGLTIITDSISYFDTNYKALKNYHSDWNWLMEVVEKIENIIVKGKQWTVLEDESDVDWNFEVNIESKQCVINRCTYDGDEEDFLKLYDCRNYETITKIEAVYNAVVAFIKWYNENAVKE